MSLRKSSSRRNGSKSEVLPKPNARRKCTPAPSRVGLASLSRRMGRIDIFAFQLESTVSLFIESSNRTELVSRHAAEQRNQTFGHGGMREDCVPQRRIRKSS